MPYRSKTCLIIGQVPYLVPMKEPFDFLYNYGISQEDALTEIKVLKLIQG